MNLKTFSSTHQTRAVVAGIYSTNSADECQHILSDSKTCIVVVEDELGVTKIMPAKRRLTHIRCIVQLRGEPTQAGVITVSAGGKMKTAINLSEAIIIGVCVLENSSYSSITGSSNSKFEFY